MGPWVFKFKIFLNFPWQYWFKVLKYTLRFKCYDGEKDTIDYLQRVGKGENQQ